MPSLNLTKNDPLVATNFWMEVDGEVIAWLTSIDGLQIELETGSVSQRDMKGTLVQQVLYSKPKMTGELTIKRLAPLEISSDALWKWFDQIRSKGMSPGNREGERKNGSVVVAGPDLKEVGRWNFFNAWPSKIVTDGLDVAKNDAIQETITIQYEKLERKK